MNIFEKQIKCRESFVYFIENYVRISHPIKGLITPDLYDYQKRLINTYEEERFVLVKKFRQGGFTTYSLLYALWKCIFFEGQKFIFISKTDKEACYLAQCVRDILRQLPDEVYPRIDKNNDHLIEFSATKSSIHFYGARYDSHFRGKAATHVVFDEVAFIEHADRIWKVIWPCLSEGGKCFAVSTTNGIHNWFYETYKDAEMNSNKFKIFLADYWENPEYNNPEWVEEMKKALGEKGWHQEVLGSFIVPELDPVAYINNDEMKDRLAELIENNKRKLSLDDIELLQQARFRLGYLEWPPQT